MSQLLIQYSGLIIQATGETLFMVIASVILSYLLGVPLGILATTSQPNSIAPCRSFYALLDGLINLTRSIPFFILIIALMPFTRLVMGSAIGPKGALIPLVIGATPFVARLVQSSLNELDRGVVESARAMGATNFQIVVKVLLPEALPSLLRGMAVTTITLVGYTAMAGAVGAGGLGDVAIRYGYHRFQPQVMYFALVVIVLLVQCIQLAFDLIVQRVDKNPQA